MTNQKRMHVVLLGISGFPKGMAAIEKTRLLGIGMRDADMDVTVICNKGSFEHTEKVNFEPKGTYEGIQYIYTTGSIYKPKNFLIRNLIKIKGWVNEIRLLHRYSKANNLDAAIIQSKDFLNMLAYKILSKIFGFTFLYLYGEKNSSMTQRQTPALKINDFLFENYALKLPDGHFPISDLLIDYIQKKAPGIPYLKIPVVCEFSKFEIEKKEDEHNYFLFCGAAVYLEVISFLLDAFDGLKNKDFYLYLIIGGTKARKKIVDQRISQAKNRDKIKTFSKIPYLELVQKYLNAKALLIPLRPTIQDRARFPHKIGEYLASGNPMITTNMGEVRSYFTHGENAIIAEDYDLIEFIEKMQYVIDHPEEAKTIGDNGKKFGKENFDYSVYGRKIKSFISSLR